MLTLTNLLSLLVWARSERGRNTFDAHDDNTYDTNNFERYADQTVVRGIVLINAAAFAVIPYLGTYVSPTAVRSHSHSIQPLKCMIKICQPNSTLCASISFPRLQSPLPAQQTG